MRWKGSRGGVLAGIGLILVVAATTAGVVLAGRDSGGRPAVTQESQKWVLARISADQRTLGVSYAAGGCTSDKGRPRVSETRSAVRISVSAAERHDDFCTLNLVIPKLTVRLNRPLAGRVVNGASRVAAITPLFGPVVERPGGLLFGRVPRVAGLRRAQAERLLRAHGFQVRRPSVSGRNGVALGTRPRHGTPTDPRPGRKVIVEVVTQ